MQSDVKAYISLQLNQASELIGNEQQMKISCLYLEGGKGKRMARALVSWVGQLDCHLSILSAACGILPPRFIKDFLCKLFGRLDIYLTLFVWKVKKEREVYGDQRTACPAIYGNGSGFHHVEDPASYCFYGLSSQVWAYKNRCCWVLVRLQSINQS